MKKYLIGFVVGAAVLLPVGALADYVVHTPHAKYIYDVGTNSGIQVEVFDDAGNKCYVAYRDRGNSGDDQPSISCLRQEK